MYNGTGEITWDLKECSALTEDPSLAASTHISKFTTASNNSRASDGYVCKLRVGGMVPWVSALAVQS